jgi:hypothetical protein
MEIAMLSALQSRPRRGGLAATACVALIGATASAAHSNPPECPPPFGTWTLEEGLVRYAGFYTEEEIRAGFAGVDRNGNGVICSSIRPADDRFYPLQIVVDDHVRDEP